MFTTITSARRTAFTALGVMVLGLVAAWALAMHAPAYASTCQGSIGTGRTAGITNAAAGTTKAVTVSTAAGRRASQTTSRSSLINVSAPVNSGQGSSASGSLINVSAPASTAGTTSTGSGPLINVTAPVSAQGAGSNASATTLLKRVEGLLGL
jgi:hypothetical protein